MSHPNLLSVSDMGMFLLIGLNERLLNSCSVFVLLVFLGLNWYLTGCIKVISHVVDRCQMACIQKGGKTSYLPFD